jgi:hypothetical protein
MYLFYSVRGFLQAPTIRNVEEISLLFPRETGFTPETSCLLQEAVLHIQFNFHNFLEIGYVILLHIQFNFHNFLEIGYINLLIRFGANEGLGMHPWH